MISVTERSRRNAWEEDDVGLGLVGGSGHSFDFNYNKHNFGHEEMYVSMNHEDEIMENSAAIDQYIVSDRRGHLDSVRGGAMSLPKSPEERELDRTVHWAMNNFQVSETGKKIPLLHKQ